MIYFIKAVVVVISIALWLLSQRFLGKRSSVAKTQLRDRLLDWLAPANQYFFERPESVRWLLIVSSLVVDSLGLFLIVQSFYFFTFQPFVAMVIVFALRQVMQAICELPPPKQVLWKDPGVPSLFVTYAVFDDFFFSGHSALAVLGALELHHLYPAWGFAVGLSLAVFEMVTVLVLRAHWTMDVFTGALAAYFAFSVSLEWSPWIDSHLNLLVH